MRLGFLLLGGFFVLLPSFSLGFVAITTTKLPSIPSFTSTNSPLFASDDTLEETTNTKKYKVFIDGEAGTTGLQVRSRLENRKDLEIISPPSSKRKDVETRKKNINEADVVILCLPDAASIEAAGFVDSDNDRTIVIDASTAHRVNDDWDYGFPELSSEQRDALRNSKRISNPGCYPTGFIGLTRPLVDAGILREGTPLTVNAISGYSGGGKIMMELFENEEEEKIGSDVEPWAGYGFGLQHKHLPEMAKYSLLHRKPIFQPQIAKFPQGMVVSVPIHYEWLNVEKNDDAPVGKKIHEILSKHYEKSSFVSVAPLGESGAKESGFLERGSFLRPDSLAGTNNMELFVFPNDKSSQLVLCARLDNLGKGASGAAVQNLNIALGLDETVGLL